MSIDTVVQIIIAAVGTILVPCVIALTGALREQKKSTEELRTTLTTIAERISSGIEPRLDKAEENINTLFDRTNAHGNVIAALKATHSGLSQ